MPIATEGATFRVLDRDAGAGRTNVLTAAPLKVGAMFFDMQDFGGLEEYAVELAAALQRRGDQVTVYCAAWTPPTNQYRRRVEAAGIRLVQPYKHLSLIASDWPTKERLLRMIVRAAAPLTCLMALGLSVVRRQSFARSRASAEGWFRNHVCRLTGPDRRALLTRLMLKFSWLRGAPDVIHIHGYTENLLFLIDWATARGVPVVYEEHQTPDPRFDWWKNTHKSINKSARILACSVASARALQQVCGAVKPIVPRPSLCPDPCPGGWTPRAFGNHRPVQVTTVARLYVTKGLTYLLEAIALVRATHPHVVFRVHGDGELRDELLEYAHRLGLDGNEIFVGPFERSELKQIMSQTDIWASASVIEGQSLALVEAMAYGCAIVTTDAGGSAELIQHEHNGLLCPQADSRSLAANISRLIESPKLRADLSAAARRSYEEGGFQPHEVAEFTEAVYHGARHDNQECTPGPQ